MILDDPERYAEYSSSKRWERHYQEGGTSGYGSYGLFARYKSTVINDLIEKNALASVVELGCGDGNQLGQIVCASYTGFDISATVVETCRKRFAGDPSRSFLPLSERAGIESRFGRFDLALSLDVIFHLVEDAVFLGHIRDLFALSRTAVVIYSSNEDLPRWRAEARHRDFTGAVAETVPDWELAGRLENPLKHVVPGEVPGVPAKARTRSDFYVYRRKDGGPLTLPDNPTIEALTAGRR